MIQSKCPTSECMRCWGILQSKTITHLAEISLVKESFRNVAMVWIQFECFPQGLGALFSVWQCWRVVGSSRCRSQWAVIRLATPPSLWSPCSPCAFSFSLAHLLYGYPPWCGATNSLARTSALLPELPASKTMCQLNLFSLWVSSFWCFLLVMQNGLTQPPTANCKWLSNLSKQSNV